MIKSLVLLAMSINSHHADGNKPIVNFDNTSTLPAYQELLDAIPYSDHLIVEAPDSSMKTGWGINSGAISYQWLTDENVHVTFGLNLGLDDSNQFGAGPTFGLKYKF